MIDAYLTANGITVQRLLEFDTMMGTLDLVAHGDWSVILPLMMMAPDIAADKYTINPIVNPPLMLELFLLEPARKTMDEAAVAFLDCLRTELAGIERIAADLLSEAARPAATPKRRPRKPTRR
jgi:DNA-binding transcriptional LysR family regulator